MNIHRQSFFAFFLNLLAIAANVAVSILIVRRLGPEGRGLYSVANSLTLLLAMVLNLGLPWANTYYASKYQRRVPALTANSLVHAVVMGLLTFGLIYGAGGWVSWLFRLPISGAPALTLILLVPAVSLLQMLNAILLGLGRVILYSQINAFVYIAFLIYCGFAAAAGRLTPHVMLVMLLLAYATLALVALRKLLKVSGFRLHPHRRLLLGAVRRIGLKAQFINFLGALLQRIDIFIVNYYHGTAAVGFYSIAVFVGQLGYQIPSVLGSVLFPLSADDRLLDENVARIGRLSRFLVALHLALFAALFAGGHLLFGLLYGPAFSGCRDTLLVLYPGLVFASLSILLSSFLAGRGYPPVIVSSAVTAAILSLTLNLALVPSMGGTGAAVAFSVAYGAMFLLLVRHFGRRYGVPLGRFLVFEPGEAKRITRYFVRFEFLARIGA